MTETTLSEKDAVHSVTEKERERNSVGGLHISKLNLIFIISSLIVTGILYWITGRLSSQYSSFVQITEDYSRIENDAVQVQSASDDLTEDVRQFVMTGERRYMNSYFKEANETKRRENAIEDLKQLGAAESMQSLLENAVQESMSLMQMEYEAMHYAARAYGYEETTLPEEVKEFALPDSEKDMTREEKLKKAQELVFGIDYRFCKSRIAGYRYEFLEKALQQVNDAKRQGKEKMEQMIMLQRIGIGGIAILCMLLFLAISRMIVRPLRNAVESIASKTLIRPVKGTYEIRYMSTTYNQTAQSNIDTQERLQEEAERDELTGVLNRRGYHVVVERLAEESCPLALLVMDVDNFKTVNDTYGHMIGDKTLKKVAGFLQDTFRASDYTARIGGDEFVVIMTDITEKNKEIINRKIAKLNKILKAPDDPDFPAVSLSVGCAFSERGYNSHLFAQADERMYRVKNSGGSNVQFVS